ncbi:hypothetical protein [uncultured Marinobacter sp.]|uniref:hypothetical protein n=1 Tax=uncultured Marinobacter sp. TaxID=187379 RepID=UPI002621EB87|nr:hypothetical protein [uncultured Marinobacter sp.]
MTESIKQLFAVAKNVTLTEFSRGPSRCFADAPVAVVSKGRPVGYLLSPELFEKLTTSMAQIKDPASLKKELNLSNTWLANLEGNNNV